MIMATRGIQNVLLFGKESAWGTPVATAKYLGLTQNFKVDISQGAKEHHGLGAAAAADIGGGLLNPKLSWELKPSNGRFLEYFVFGGTTTHVDSTADCTHTLVYANDMPSFTVHEAYEKGGSDLENVFAGFLSESCNLSLNLDGELSASVSGPCKDLDASGTTAESAPTQNEAPIKGFQGSLGIGGAVSLVQSWSVNISRNAKVIHGMGARVPADGGSNLLNVSFSAKIGYNASTFDAAILGAAAGGTAVEPAAATVTLGADNGTALGSGKRAISMALSNCQYTSVTRDSGIGDFVFTDISGVGKLSTTTFNDQIIQSAW